MPNISHNLTQVKRDILKTAESHGLKRQPRLIAVSKRQPTAFILEAFAAEHRDFGENYAQELEQKAIELADKAICWHFIGPIQSNKTRIIAQYSHWVHSIDRLKVAQRLNDHRLPEQPLLNVCIQVNIDQEVSKSGVAIESLPELIQGINALPRLALQGLMVIPQKNHSAAAFRQLAELANHYGLTELSMGMSQDMSDAISAGSTMVRIGTAVFGERPK